MEKKKNDIDIDGNISGVGAVTGGQVEVHIHNYSKEKDENEEEKDLEEFDLNLKDNPYKGLFHFTYEDRANYFGREKESKAIAQTVKESRFFTLLGASGSGKSSLLFAGVLPLIEGKNISILDFRPQDRPFRNLANIFIPILYPDKLLQVEKKDELTNKLLSGNIKLNNLVELYFENQKIEKLYIIIDQFEELFTLTKDNKIKKHFLDQLLSLLESNLEVTLILSLRADFLSFASYFEPLNHAINQNPKTILGLMSSENLQRAIELPAQNLGVGFEKGLVERILKEISNEAGQLPLLEFALEQFWQKMNNRVITHKSLDEMGSISHAISYHADKIYKKHTQNQDAIRRVFLKLVNVGGGTEDTRRVAKFEDFDKNDREIITLLANDRLVITRENSVEVVHEALIREWSVLKAWIEEYREFLEWEKRTRIDIEFYKENGEREEDLLRDGRLLRAKEFLDNYEGEISRKFRDFIEKSMKSQKRRVRKKTIIESGLFVIFAILAGVSSYFGGESNSLGNMAYKGLQEKIVEKGLIYKNYLNDPLKAKLLFANAVKESPTETLEKEAKILYNFSSKEIKVKKIESNNLLNMPSSEIIYTNDNYKLTVLDRKNNKTFYILKREDIISAIKYNQDKEERVGLGDGWDKICNKAEVLSWTDNMVIFIEHNRGIGWKVHTFKHNKPVIGAKFNKYRNKILSWSSDNTIRLLYINSIDLHGDGELFVLKHNAKIQEVKFSKDEEEILSWSSDNTIKLWDSKNGKELLVLTYDYDIDGVKFSKDEKEIISWSKDGKIKTYKLYRDRKLKKEFYPLEAEVESGCTLKKSGEIRVLSKEEWEKKKRRYKEALRVSE